MGDGRGGRLSGWRLKAATGAAFAALSAPVFYLTDSHPSVVGALIGGVAAGAVYGLLFGGLVQRTRVESDSALGGLSRRGRRAVQRAAARGPVPSDPAERLRAHRLAQLRLGFMRRSRPLMLIGLPLLLAVFVAGALLDSPLYWLAVAGLALLAAMWFLDYRRIERRIDLLRPEDEAQRT